MDRIEQAMDLGFLVGSAVSSEGQTTNDDALDWVYIQTAILVFRQDSYQREVR